VETICVSGASPNSLEDGASAMHIVVSMHISNALKLTKVLLQDGGDPNVEDEEKLTPTHVAVIRGNAKVLQLLLRNATVEIPPRKMRKVGMPGITPSSTAVHHVRAYCRSIWMRRL